MRVHRVCTVAIVMSLLLAGPALAGVSPDGRGGVVKEHPGTGIAHHLTDALPHLRAVAVDGAVGAEGLDLHPGAVV